MDGVAAMPLSNGASPQPTGHPGVARRLGCGIQMFISSSLGSRWANTTYDEIMLPAGPAPGG